MNSIVKVSEIISETFDEYISCHHCQEIVKSTKEDLLNHNESCSRTSSAKPSESFELIENEASNEKTSFDIIFQQSLQSDVENSNSDPLQNSSEVLENKDTTQKSSFDIVFQKSLQDTNAEDFMSDEKENEVSISKPVQNKKMLNVTPLKQKGMHYLQKDSPRFDSVMTVTCKSMTAKMYKEKFESGGKGKCILFQQEWLTPNRFEEMAGSKSRKYLASIKCLGRPLGEFVGSGELTPTLLHRERKKSPKKSNDIESQYDKDVLFGFSKEEQNNSNSRKINWSNLNGRKNEVGQIISKTSNTAMINDKFACELCPSVFKRKESLMTHKSLRHPDPDFQIVKEIKDSVLKQGSKSISNQQR